MNANHHFALLFSDVDVQFMLKDSGSTDWTSLHRLALSAPDFQNEMTRFCDSVRQDCNGETSVTVYLPDTDVSCGSVSVLGRTHKARELHVRRTLARQCGDQADNIVFHVGQANDEKIAPVCFALKATLNTAEQFVQKFGFKVGCFSTFANHDLNDEACLMLPHQIERLKRMNAVPKVSYGFRGAIAAMIVVGVFVGASIPKPNAVMMARIVDGGHVPPQPVHVALHIAGFEKTPVNDRNGALQPDTEVGQNSNASNPDAIIFANLPRVEKIRPTNLTVSQLGADRIVPSVKDANLFDAIASHTGGFAVYMGLQANLTQLNAGNEQNIDAGQVVHIHKATSGKIQVARGLEPFLLNGPLPDQFRLTEREIASFSRP
jgi:hypothetical protein